MWRTKAVERMLLEDIAGLARGETNGDGPAHAEQALAAARRRAWRAVVVDWAAIVALLALRLGDGPLLVVGPSVDAVFAIGLLLVAVHSGFRLGQVEKLRAVAVLVEELSARRADGEPG